MRVAISEHAEMWVLAIALVVASSSLAQSTTLKDFEQEITTLLDGVHPSVVTIHAYSSPKSGSAERSRFPYASALADTQIGTGVVYDSAGHIVTTGHVVRGGSRFEVFSSDGRRFEAVVVGVDSRADVAVLRITAKVLQPLALNTVGKVAPGSILFVLGNSFGIANAANLGTAVGYRDDGSLQVSANLAPGFSGGPVINVDGEMVGLVSAKLTEPVVLNSLKLQQTTPTGSRTYGFSNAQMELPSTGVILAVAAASLKSTADRLISGGRLGRGFLGVQPEDVDPDWMVKAFNVSHGIMIADVLPRSPAGKAGIHAGDILTQYLGRRITNSDQLRELIGNCKPGDVVSISIVRGGRSINMTVQLASMDAFAGLPQFRTASATPDSAAAGDVFDLSMGVDYRQDLEDRIERLQMDLARQMREIDLLKKQLNELDNKSK
jgi:serine protease Do